MGFGKMVLRGRREREFSENYINRASKNVPLTKQRLDVKCRSPKWVSCVESTVEYINTDRYCAVSGKKLIT